MFSIHFKDIPEENEAGLPVIHEGGKKDTKV